MTCMDQEVCKKTEYPDLCISSLRSDPRSVTADSKGLARILLDQHCFVQHCHQPVQNSSPHGMMQPGLRRSFSQNHTCAHWKPGSHGVRNVASFYVFKSQPLATVGSETWTSRACL
ncbi:hypothetical protein ACH5RR_026991 [Cinchona calisaya]|uniref:Pectinesterase inhibitor domain-containing protein n=1 Tax=Cinchona calisaya TaxID=153742 RepID=A0ABD2Z469_9GENT